MTTPTGRIPASVARISTCTPPAIEGIRQRPPVTPIPANNNELGARNEMTPTEYIPEEERLVKRVSKTDL